MNSDGTEVTTNDKQQIFIGHTHKNGPQDNKQSWYSEKYPLILTTGMKIKHRSLCWRKILDIMVE